MPPAAHIEDRIQLLTACFIRFGFFGALRLLATMFVARRLGRRYVDVRLPHSRRTMRLRVTAEDSDVATFRQIFIRGDYDIHNMSHAERLLEKARRGLSILDCGANIGCSTLYFEQTFPGARIVAVEPEPKNFELLRHNTGNSPQTVCLRSAAWGENAELRLTNHCERSWAFRTEAAEAGAEDTMPGETVGALLQRLPPSEALIVKMDVEGAERQIFSGSSAWLGEVDLLIIETHDWMLPWQGSSRPLLAALNREPVELQLRGENLFCFFDRV